MKTENNKIKTWTTKRIKPKTYWGTCAIFVVALFLILLGVCELIRWGFRYEEQKQREKFEEYEEVEQAIKSQRKVQAVAFRENDILNKIIQCESGGDRFAKNSNSSALGIFQIIDGTKELCERNLGVKIDRTNEKDSWKCALWLYNNYGLSHWECKDLIN